MGKASDWLQAERRKVLGDWVAFCGGCGYTLRYFEDFEAELPQECPTCGGKLRSRCPACNARIASAFAVACEACGGKLRPPEWRGVKIRKAK